MDEEHLMDFEIALRRAEGAVGEPASAIVARHRAQLVWSIANGGTPRWRSEDSVPGVAPIGRRVSPSRRGAWMVAASAAAILALAWTAVTYSGDRGTSVSATGVAGSESATSFDLPASSLDRPGQGASESCGEVPFELVVPPGSTLTAGPLVASAPPHDGQVVAHWTGPTSSGEVRWPADPQPDYGEPREMSGLLDVTMTVSFGDNGAESVLDVYLSGPSTESTASVPTPTPQVGTTAQGQPENAGSEAGLAADVEFGVRVVSSLEVAPVVGCELVQLFVMKPPSDSSATMWLSAYPGATMLTGGATGDVLRAYDARPVEALVTAEQHLAQAPSASQVSAHCQVAPAGRAASVDSQTFDLATFDSPVAALRDFLVSSTFAEGLPRSGYIEIRTDDGQWFAHPGPSADMFEVPPDMFEVLVAAGPGPAGWAIEQASRARC